VNFLCLIDPTLPQEKVDELESASISTQVVELGLHATYRDSRIQLATELDSRPGWIWTRQYDNPANVKAHYETTGPEIWSQMEGQVDYVVASVGTGGTICGVGQFIKHQNPRSIVVAVEPDGSTIFGGKPGYYLSVGAGMSCPSGIIRRYGGVIDYCCHIDDATALRTCIQMHAAEDIGVGVTSGSVLTVALYLAREFPDKCIAAIAPDGIERYKSLLNLARSVDMCDDSISLYVINHQPGTLNEHLSGRYA
jgi:cysteine synthase